MNITTCSICGQSIGFGEGMFKGGVHNDCYLKAPKCNCGNLLYKGMTFENDGQEFCSEKCLKVSIEQTQ